MHRDELDRAAEQRVHHVDVLFARQAEDVLDAFVLEAAHQELRGRLRRRFLGHVGTFLGIGSTHDVFPLLARSLPGLRLVPVINVGA